MSDDRTFNLELYADLATRKLVSSDGAAFTLPPLTLGDRLLCSVRALERADAGDLRERDLPVRTLNASIGKTLEPPTSGTFRLRGEVVVPAANAVLLLPANLQSLAVVYAFTLDPEGTPLHGLDIYGIPAGNGQEVVDYINSLGGGFIAADFVGAQIRLSAQSPELHLGATGDNFQVYSATAAPVLEHLDPLDSAPISATDDAAALAGKVGPVVVGGITGAHLAAPGCWLFRATDGAQFPLAVGPENRLDPISFVRVRQFQKFPGEWWVEVRLIQTPLAFNEAGHERVLPPPPSVRRIRAGNPGGEAQPPVNELQALLLPPAFRGTYFLRWNYRVTRVLGIEDGPDEIAEALNAMFEGATAAHFEVTNPEPDNAYLEFVGPLAGDPQPLVSVEVNSFLPGTLTFVLPLDRAEMCAALRTAPQIDVPFEVEIELGDPETPEVPGRVVTLFTQTVRIVREQIFRELQTVQRLDWQNPPAARDYLPFTRDQVIFGVQHYVASFGDGQVRQFSFPHNLGTNALHVAVRENTAGGKLLVLGVDYSISLPSDTLLQLDIAAERATPAVNALAIVVSSAGPISAFLAHTHTMAQITGLLDALASVNARLEHLEDLLPTSSLARREERPEAHEIEFPDRLELYPGRFPEGFNLSSLKDEAGAGKLALPRSPGLLPAVHDATIANLAVPLPAPLAHAGNVFVNATAGPVLIPGAAGRRSAFVEVGGHVASDGRFWYRVAKSGATNSFFPVDLERELFLLHVNEAMWQPGETLSVGFDLELQLLAANTRGQMVVVIEAGTAPGQSTPAPTDPKNLERIAWASEPLLVQRVVVSGVRIKHHFGALLKRSAQDAITAERLNYTAWSTAPVASLPTAPGVVLRARLVQFDTENNVKGASGFIFYSLTEARASIS